MKSGVSFDGTLFRFPLRTKTQAKRSEIGKKHYDKSSVEKALQSLKQVAIKTMIFLNNVRHVKVFQLSKDAKSPENRVLLFEINAMSNALQSSVTQSQLLKHSSSLLHSLMSIRKKDSICSSIIYVSFADSTSLLNSQKSERWLVSSAIGQNESLQFAKTDVGRRLGLMPFAGVAFKLSGDGQTNPEVVKGEAFCFLPLSLATGLPFHVNGSFSILSNRRGLWWYNTEASFDEERKDVDAYWNDVLIRDAVKEALLTAFQALLSLLGEDFSRSNYYSLWPNFRSTPEMWKNLATCFYSVVVCERPGTAFLSAGADRKKRWVRFSEALLLSPKVKNLPHAEFLTKLSASNYVEIPDDCRHVIDGFKDANKASLTEKTLSVERFARTLLVKALTVLSPLERDKLIQAILRLVWQNDDVECELNSILKDLEIFPCSPEGKVFRRPRLLVQPEGLAIKLFAHEDGRFPHSQSYNSEKMTSALKKLGMKTSKTLNWEDALERMKSVKRLSERQDTVGRVEAIMKLMDNLNKSNVPCDTQFQKNFRSVAFLPVMKCPRDYLLGSDWYANENLAAPCPGKVFYGQWWQKISSQAVVLHHWMADIDRFPSVLPLLGLSPPPLNMVQDQLEVALKHVTTKLHDGAKVPVDLERLLHSLYEELNKRLENGKESVALNLKAYSSRSWILVSGCLVSAAQLAFEWRNGKTAPPYLFEVPPGLRSLHLLFLAGGVKKRFEPSDFSSALIRMGRDTEGRKLSEEESIVAYSLVTELAPGTKKWRQSLRGDMEVPLISEGLLLVPATQLTYVDVTWARDPDDHKEFVHSQLSVTQKVAVELGVKLVRDRVLDAYSLEFPGLAFGQHEPLTRRLKNIIEEYPWGTQILKELVQNADDAKASVLHIVYDKRQHPAERVFTDNWKNLHGPALLVYNDRPFSEDDIKGIQELGLGSKRDDPAKTGRYGIGFNAVYHLTDCPSFISDEKIFCIMDPHCRYIDGATLSKPGMMFEVSEELKKKFADVYSCYYSPLLYPGGISLSGGTLFRFPLRNGEQKSDISNTVVTEEDMDSLLKEFDANASDLLLFLNSVRSIKLSVIEANGDSKQLFSVSVDIEPSALEKRQAMVKRISASKEIATDAIPFFDVVYELSLTVIRETAMVSEQKKWLVYQCIGRGPGCKSAFGDVRELALLPRAGIAARLDEKMTSNGGRAYCFLPLPIEVPLPVYVNGHFVLDSARRNIFGDTSFGSNDRTACDRKQQWNENLVDLALAPAYATFLLEARAYVADTGEQEVENRLKVLDKRLDWFHSLFPQSYSQKSYWDHLAHQVYVTLQDQDTLPTFLALVGRPLPSDRFFIMESHVPALKSIVQGRVDKWEKSFPAEPTLAWLPVGVKKIGQYQIKKALFWNSSEMQTAVGSQLDAFVLKAILHLLGLPIVTTSRRIFSGLKDSVEESTVEMTSPISVYNFLYLFDHLECPCNLQLGAIEDTLLETPENVNLVLNFLFQTPEKPLSFKKLDGLPLLLTEDGCLKEFSEEDPVYVSRFPQLLPFNPHLFVHSSIRKSAFRSFFFDTKVFSDTKAVTRLTPSELLRRVEEAQMFDQSCRNQIVSRGKQLIPDDNWIEFFWKYLATEGVLLTSDSLASQPTIFNRETDQTSFERATEVFFEWPIIPVIIGTSSYCVPPSKAHCVLCITNSEMSIQTELWKLGIPVLDAKLVEYSAAVSLIRGKIATVGSPNKIVKALRFFFGEPMLYSENRLDVSVVEEILKYFNLCICPDGSAAFTSSDLISLPLFENVSGQCVKISSVVAFTLPEDLPQHGADIWMAASKGTVFLRRKPELANLYHFLKLNGKSLATVYVEYILKSFSKLTDEDRMEHLLFLMPLCGNYMYGFHSQWPDVVKKLKVTPCFFQRGSLRCVSFFFDPTVRIFKLMLEGDDFPPLPPKPASQQNDEENLLPWLNFLTSIGLQTVAKEETLIQFAKSLESDGRKWQAMNDEETALWEEKSGCLFCFFADNRHRYQNNGKHIWKVLSSIKFLPVAEVEDNLAVLSTPFYDRDSNNNNRATSFKQSVLFTTANERLCWTSTPLLPRWPEISCNKSWVCPRDRPSMEEVLNNLRNYTRDAISGELKPQMKHKAELVEEAQQMCLSLFSYLEQTLTFHGDVPEFSVLTDLRNSQSFFQKQLPQTGHASSAEYLHKMSYIFIPDDELLATPSQLVRRGTKISPYLFELPDEYGPHKPLLQRLGMDVEARPFHYARVLEEICKRSVGGLLSPNEKESAKSAVKNLFDLLKEVCGSIGLANMKFLREPLYPLYLLDQDDNMQLSNQLVYLDCIQYKSHIDQLPYSFLMDLTECGLSSLHEETVDLLPKDLQPQKLSSLAVTVIKSNSSVDSSNEALIALARDLEYTLTSPNFICGMYSIYVHESRKEKMPSRLNAGLTTLSEKFKVKCLEVFSTCLLLPDMLDSQYEVEEAAADGNVFLQEGEEAFLFVSEAALKEDKTMLGIRVTSCILTLLGTQIRQENAVLAMILKDDPADIPNVLIGLGITFITPNDEIELHHKQPKVALGKEVIPEHWIMLEKDPGFKYNPDEWVSYETEEDRVIYAKIVNEVFTEDGGDEGLLKRSHYEIDVGKEESVVADSLQLYKFSLDRRSPDHSSLELVAAGESGPGRDDTERLLSLEEKIDRVRRLLIEIWDLPADAKKKAIKRLYLKWHPETDDPDAEEVFKFLLGEIERREEGGSTSSSGGFTGASAHRWSSHYSAWDESFRRQRNRYHSGFHPGNSRQSHYPPPPPPSPSYSSQPSIGKMFLQQARADLIAAEENYDRQTSKVNDNKNFALVCFLCHETVEKSLKGVLLCKEGVDPDRQKKHELHFFLHARFYLDSTEASMLRESVLKLDDRDYIRSRYPDVSHTVPAHCYSQEAADNALAYARKVFCLLSRFEV